MKDNDAFIDLSPTGAKYAICTDWFQAILATSDPFVFDVSPEEQQRLSARKEAIDATTVVLNGDLPEIMGYDDPDPVLVPDKKPKKLFVPLDEYSFFDGEIVLKRVNDKGSQFRYGYDIIYKRKSFGHVSVIPSSGYCFEDNEMMFKLNNNVHYENAWGDDFDYIMKKMKWSMVNVSRLDIALDGQGYMDFYQNYVMSEVVEKIGKTDSSERLTSKRKLKTFYIGSRKSDRYITCYDKTKELNDKGHKEYIKKYWERSGLDYERVERMELRLTNEAIKLIKDFDYKRLNDFEYIASIFRSACEGGFYMTEEKIRKGKIKPAKKKFCAGLLDFVEKTTDTNITRRIEDGKRVRFINWDYIGGVKLERLTTRETNEVYSMQITAKTMARIYFATGNDMYLHLCHEVASNSNNLQWVNDRWDKWKKDFEDRKENKKFDYLPKYQAIALTKTKMLMLNKPVERAYADLFFVRS
jgi:hypothetical protein